MTEKTRTKPNENKNHQNQISNLFETELSLYNDNSQSQKQNFKVVVWLIPLKKEITTKKKQLRTLHYETYEIVKTEKIIITKHKLF